MNKDDVSLTAATEAQHAAPEAGNGMQPGTRVRDYVIRRLLGEGGMGRVYLADQIEPVQRQVALKIIREPMTSSLARARFELERQALAQMQHPGIAQVFDAGITVDGSAYLAMELVDGEPITHYCQKHKLDLASRLALFEKVCHGVQHAHQKGVIHRDLKPDNVLVRSMDGAPTPKIIDFGIAIGERAEGDAGSHGRAGTRTYMSPEQASRQRRDLDTRSDVYSLGVMLFEVLTGDEAARLGSKVFQSHMAAAATWHETIQATLVAADANVDLPSGASSELLAAAQRLPAELRAVLSKALQSDRKDRYDSAAALAEDLHRFTERRPLLAVPPSRAYLARKFLSRHRFGLAAATIAGCAIIVGLGLAIHGQRRAEAAAIAARVEADKAETVSAFVTDMLSGIDPDIAKGKDSTLMRMVLDRAAQRAGSELAGKPYVRASIEETIAKSYAALSLYKPAAAHARAAVEAAARAGLPLMKQARLATSQALFDVEVGDPEQAVTLARAALARVAMVPESDPGKLGIEHDLGVLEWRTGQLASSRAHLEHVLAIRQTTLPPGDPDLIDTVAALALLASETGDYERAGTLYMQVLAADEKHYGVDNSNTIDTSNELAIVYLRQKQFAKAEALLRKWLPIAQRVMGPDHSTTMMLYSNLGGAIRQQGRNEEARPYYERVQKYNLDKYGPDSSYTVMAESNLSLLLRDAGELDAAEQHARVALEHVDAALGSDNPMRGYFHAELGTILLRKHRYGAAETALKRGYALLAEGTGYGPQHPLAQNVAGYLVDLYTAWGRPAEADVWLSRQASTALASSND